MEYDKRAKIYLYPTKTHLVKYLRNLIDSYNENDNIENYETLLGDILYIIKSFDDEPRIEQYETLNFRTVEEVRGYRDAYDDIVSFFRNKKPSDNEINNIMNKHGDLLKDFIESDYSDFDWGMICGKLSTLRWLLGEDWDSLDT